MGIPVLTTENIVTAIAPFSPDDNHKGTFLVLRIAGADNRTALKLINRKYRSWQNWRSTDENFRELDDLIPSLQGKYGTEAKMLRVTTLDISIIEAGIIVFGQIINGKAVNSDKWAFASRLAGLRIPLMKVAENSGNPWDRLSAALRDTAASQQEFTIKEIDENGREKSVTTKQTIIPSQDQQNLASAVVNQLLGNATP